MNRKKIDLPITLYNKLTYIIAIVFSIYFASLIYNAYSINIKDLCIISIVFSFISCFLVFLFNKHIKRQEIDKKALKYICVIAMILSIGILIYNFDFFTKKFTEINVKIVALQEKNEHSLSNKVCIKNIVQANQVIYLGAVKLNEDWTYSNEKICSEDEKYGELTLSLKKDNGIKIVFETDEKSGKVKVIDGNHEDIIDLYSYKTGQYNYEVKNNCYADSMFILKLLCSYAMLLFITVLLILSSYYLYKTKKSIILPTLILIFSLRIFFYSNLQVCTLYPDSVSYIEYNFSELSKLNLPARTPVYPLIIEMCKNLFGGKLFLNFVVFFQILVSFIALIYFYKLLTLIIKNEKVVAFITIIYGSTGAIWGWDNCILTESLALSGYVFFLYNIVKYIKKANLLNGIMAVIISIILTFLRPTSLILTVFLFAFWIGRFIFDRKEIKTDFECFIGSVLSLVLIVVYSIVFYQTHQIYSISDPTIRQNLFICIDQGFYKASDNKQFIEDIEAAKEQATEKNGLEKKVWIVEKEIQEKYGNKKVQELSSYCRNQMIPQYIQYLINLVKKHSNIQYSGYSSKIPNYDSVIYDILVFITKIVNFSYVYLMIVIELIITIYKWIKDKKVPWIHIGIFGFSFAIIASSFIGTNAEYMRTSIGVVPFFYMALAMLIDYILLANQKNMTKSLK